MKRLKQSGTLVLTLLALALGCLPSAAKSVLSNWKALTSNLVCMASGANPSTGTYNVEHVRITVYYTPAASRNRVIISRSIPVVGRKSSRCPPATKLNATVSRFETEFGGDYAKR